MMQLDPKSLSATARYVSENEGVLALRRLDGRPANIKRLYRAPTTYRRDFRCFLSWLRETTLRRSNLQALRALEGTRRGRPALVLGNGPSQGYLDADDLHKFKAHGELFCVNYWTENSALAEVLPSFLLISDPLDLVVADRDGALDSFQRKFYDYVLERPAISLCCPSGWIPAFTKTFGNRCIGFADTEIRSTRNINPLYPRGYTGLSVYKSLAIALYCGYDPIYVLGMDNTYPRNLYCDPGGFLLNVESHAGMGDCLTHREHDVASEMYEIYQLFEDINHFARQARSTVVNLDPYSLTDAFPKVRTIDEGKALLAAIGRSTAD